jgi:hypothetical protein
MIWFIDIPNLRAGEQRWRELVRLHHPDKGGDPALFRAIEQEWRDVQAYFRVASSGAVVPLPEAKKKPRTRSERTPQERKTKRKGTEAPPPAKTSPQSPDGTGITVPEDPGEVLGRFGRGVVADLFGLAAQFLRDS